MPDDTMSIPLLIGRDTLKLFNYRLTKNPSFGKVVSEMLSINSEFNCSNLNVNPEMLSGLNVNPKIHFWS